jgi:hypothetical protein
MAQTKHQNMRLTPSWPGRPERLWKNNASVAKCSGSISRLKRFHKSDHEECAKPKAVDTNAGSMRGCSLPHTHYHFTYKKAK